MLPALRLTTSRRVHRPFAARMIDLASRVFRRAQGRPPRPLVWSSSRRIECDTLNTSPLRENVIQSCYGRINILRYRISVLTLGCLLAFGIQPAKADAVYTYTGKPFTIVSAPYTTADFVSGELTLAAPLAPNLPLSDLTNIDSFSLSDGQQTLGSSTPLPLQEIQVSTDASGNITSWHIFLGLSTSHFISTQDIPNVTADAGALNSTQQADNDATPGVWRSSVSATPEPASLALFTAGLLALMVFAFRKERAHQ